MSFEPPPGTVRRFHGVTLDEAHTAALRTPEREREWVAKLGANELAVFTLLKTELDAVEVDEGGWPFKERH